jgi:hypothetical protein
MTAYLIAVVIILGLYNFIAWRRGGNYPLMAGWSSGGFLAGMLAMYIAVHFYQ